MAGRKAQDRTRMGHINTVLPHQPIPNPTKYQTKPSNVDDEEVMILVRPIDSQVELNTSAIIPTMMTNDPSKQTVETTGQGFRNWPGSPTGIQTQPPTRDTPPEGKGAGARK